MATIKFKLRTTNNPSTIFLRFLGGRKFDFSIPLPLQVNPKNWNEKKEEVRNTLSANEKEQTNTKLRKIKTNILNSFNELNGNTSLVNKQWLQDIVNKTLTTTIIQHKKTLIYFIEDYIIMVKTKPSAVTGKLLSISRQKSYQGTLNKLNLFGQEIYKLNYDTITMDFYYDFIEWCESKGYSKNYIGKFISNIKHFMSEAHEEMLHNNLVFKSKKFKKLAEDTDELYLTIEELNKIEEVDLSNYPEGYNTARDLFIIGAYTGLRVSDFNNLSEDNILYVIDTKVIKVATKKTGEPVVIPIHPIVNRILDKRNGDLPPKLSDQKINDYLKVIGKEAEINANFKRTSTKGGEKVTTLNPRYEHIKTHTARRSFCTNAYLSGMDSIDIMA
ncbi:MAG: phage integrase SAM-like domain-containing protein, partial [Flavobacteriales bacterium]|nr:phage integrase SAM-like domain-containing protein [Flavobacteriales bacterium]